MSKPALDSDLYGDIYGEDDNDYAVPLHETEDKRGSQKEQQESYNSSPSNIDTSPFHQPTLGSRDAIRSLPAKPLSPNSGSLSYSAQIAQQFSAYQQTPSQERQQRTEISSSKRHPSEGSLNTATVDTVFGKKPSEMHDSGKLFIGGLNWDTTDEGLRDYFSQFGKVDACTIMRDPSGTSRGFAFLTFEDPEAISAIVAREHFLDGKAIDPKRAIPREEHLRNTRYFVGGLSPTTTSDSMRVFFGAYGKVVDATVMLDRESGRSKGFGFVTFEDAANVDQLVGRIGLILDDKQIEVKMAQPRSQRDQARAASMTVTSSNREAFFNDQGSRLQPPNVTFASQQPNAMSLMFQRSMGQIPMLGGGMPMLGMNPMAMAMGMGMNAFNPMGGMGGMNMMGGINGANTLNGMGNMGAMRLGMGPMGAGMAGNTSMNMNGMGVGMRPGMGGLVGGPNMGRMAMNTGPGPSRMTSRGQHSFHPYAR